MYTRFTKFVGLITKINRCVKKIKTEETEKFKLKSTHVSCLLYLYKAGSASITTMCDVLEEDKAAISRTIDYLEKNSFVLRDPSKKYKTEITLKERGRVVGARLWDKVEEIVSKIDGLLTDDERAILYGSLGKISNTLTEYCNGYPVNNE